MTLLSNITHYYNNKDAIVERVEQWKRLPLIIRKKIEFIIIDDGSKDKFNLDLEGLNAKFLRITSNIPWNQPGARNLGVIYSQSSWMLLHDVDQYFYDRFYLFLLEYIIANKLSRDFMYFIRIKELVDIQNGQNLKYHPNSFVVDRDQFISSGMYDEDFSGSYGYDDTYVTKTWLRMGHQRALLPEVFSENRGAGTTDLNRNLEKNKELLRSKLSSPIEKVFSGTKIRFVWSLISTSKT